MAEKKKIILIDDEEDFCFFIKQNLEATQEFEVKTAHTGKNGINLAFQEAPDLILLDIILPGMSGTEVAEVLLGDYRTKKIPIIFLTAVVTEEDTGGINSAQKIGGNTFLAKTAGTQEMISSIKKVLT